MKTFDEERDEAAKKHLAFMSHHNPDFEIRIFCGGADWAKSYFEKEVAQYKKAIDDMTKGIPSEWAYAQLKKENEELKKPKEA